MTAKIIKALGVSAMLGFSAMPLCAFAVNPDDAEVQVTINPSISMTLTNHATVSLDTNTTKIGKSDSFYSEVKVSTNAMNGYTVSVKEKSDGDAKADLKNAATGAVIEAKDGEPVAGVATWAIKSAATGSAATTYKAVPGKDATGLVLVNKGMSNATSKTYVDDITDVEYAVSSGNSTIPSGTYVTTITYTATANANS